MKACHMCLLFDDATHMVLGVVPGDDAGTPADDTCDDSRDHRDGSLKVLWWGGVSIIHVKTDSN